MTEQETEIVKKQILELRDKLIKTFEEGTKEVEKICDRTIRRISIAFTVILVAQHIALYFVYSATP